MTDGPAFFFARPTLRQRVNDLRLNCRANWRSSPGSLSRVGQVFPDPLTCCARRTFSVRALALVFSGLLFWYGYSYL